VLTPRIYVAGPLPAPGAECALPDAAARHVGLALRMRTGDPIALFTGAGGECAATIVGIDRRKVTVRIDRHDPVERESPTPVTLVQAVVAADMMDSIVRKAVELGAVAIAPVQAARSQHVSPERNDRRLAHWRQIVVAACEQCGRNRLPDVMPVRPFADWIDAVDASAGSVVLLDAAAARSLADVGRRGAPRMIGIGPEGGFTPDELRLAQRRHATLAHIGSRTLRAETAAVAALATLNAIAGDAR
jgi:16S rRNA (uracil1498-N3)-methyltransferase